jgi:XTP/dITP diphosphohydrolase
MKGREDRQARFRCTMVLARDGREEAVFSGVVEGKIVETCRGTGGFGYDPLFVPDGHAATFAELGAEVKNQLSHRARALAQVVEFLESR